uniref:Uncharacterized protein n=1 Tax=Romanomermis culicivorax TaxID=13658 RepID=A0A915IKW8_ROMCU
MQTRTFPEFRKLVSTQIIGRDLHKEFQRKERKISRNEIEGKEQIKTLVSCSHFGKSLVDLKLIDKEYSKLLFDEYTCFCEHCVASNMSS